MEKENVYILVAEDDADDRFLLQSAFDENSFTETLLFVDNGIEVMNKLNSIRNAGGEYPKIIILDLNMPKKDGRETLKELKTSPYYKDIPVIIFSTTDNEQEIEHCYHLGANSYFFKPDNYAMFISKTNEIHNRWLSRDSVIPA